MSYIQVALLDLEAHPQAQSLFDDRGYDAFVEIVDGDESLVREIGSNVLSLSDVISEGERSEWEKVTIDNDDTEGVAKLNAAGWEPKNGYSHGTTTFTIEEA